ncbi:MAG: DNA recombination protein RmuC [Candidatus Nomurabacteria bacterium]|jgi:DNA recombination protein RmuC|nr:DNA recombination protein RmuC [Candidatus Nomurabacteria bacterium]
MIDIWVVLVIVIALSVVFITTLLILQHQRKFSGGEGLNDLSRRLDDMTKMMNDNALRHNESIHKQFAASQKLVADITERMTKFEDTNKNILKATDKLEDLQNILLNPKHRGNFGEFQLASLLENYFPPTQWQAQYQFKNGDKVDAALFLKDSKILPIDSKFSLENYNRMISEKDSVRKKVLAKEVYKDLKNRIDETAKYIRPTEDTMDFAFMFIPSEALYYDMFLVKVGEAGASRDLMEYATRDKKVIVVSPTTFVAYLQTVLQGLRGLEIEKQAKSIQKRVGQLGAHLGKYQEYMAKLGNSLGTTVSHFNTAHKELKKADHDVVKIVGGSETVDPLLLDKPNSD